MKKLFIGAVIGALITAFLFIKFMPRPGPVKIVYRDKIVYAQMSGQAIISSQKPKMDHEDGDNTQTINNKGSVKIVPLCRDSGANNSSDFTASVPVTGEIKTSHVDLQFTGVTTVECKGDNLTVNTIFDNDVKETIYQEPVKTWHIGLDIIVTNDGFGMGWHAQKDFPIWGDLVAFGRVEADREWIAKAGIEYSF